MSSTACTFATGALCKTLATPKKTVMPTLREWAQRAYPDPAYRDKVARAWKIGRGPRARHG